MNQEEIGDLFKKPFQSDLFRYWEYQKEKQDSRLKESLKLHFLLMFRNFPNYLNVEKEALEISVIYSNSKNTLLPTKEDRLFLTQNKIPLVSLYKELNEDKIIRSTMSIYAMNYLFKLPIEEQTKYLKNKSKNVFHELIDEPYQFVQLTKGKKEFTENIKRLDFYLMLSPMLLDSDFIDKSIEKEELIQHFISVNSFAKGMSNHVHMDLLIEDMLLASEKKYGSFADFIYTTSSHCIYVMNDTDNEVQNLLINPNEYKKDDYKTIEAPQTPLRMDLMSDYIDISATNGEHNFKPFLACDSTYHEDIEVNRPFDSVYLLLARAVEINFKRRMKKTLYEELDSFVISQTIEQYKPLTYLLLIHPFEIMEKILVDDKKPYTSFLMTLFAIPQVEKQIFLINSLGYNLELNEDEISEKDVTIPFLARKVVKAIYDQLALSKRLVDEHLPLRNTQIMSVIYPLLITHMKENIDKELTFKNRSIEKLEKEIDKLEKRIAKLKTENRSQHDELKEKRKLLSNSSLLKEKEKLEKSYNSLKEQSQSEIERKDEVIQSLKENHSAEIEQLKRDFEYQLKKANETIEKSKAQVKSLNDKVLELRSQSNESVVQASPSSKEVDFEEWLRQGKFLLESPSKEFYQHQIITLIKDYVDLQANAVEIKETYNARYGYVLLEGQDTYVVFADGTKDLVTDIPNDIFLSDYQFIKVGKDGKYLFMYYYSYMERFKDKFVQDYGVIESVEDNQLTIRGYNDESYTLTVTYKSSQYVPHSIVGYKRTSDGIEIIRTYDRLYVNLDIISKAISQKGFSPYVYMKSISNGLIVLNVNSNQEQFVLVKENEEHPIANLREGEVIILNESEDNAIIRTFHPNFYKYSSIYPSQVAVINRIEEDNRVFVEKTNGEIVLMNNVPYKSKLEVGTSVMIDENNDFIQFYNQFKYNKETLEKRISNRSNTTKSISEKVELPPITNTVAVISNPKYSVNTKQVLRKYGYEATTIDGFSTYASNKMTAKNYDIVVVVPSQCSHENFWSFKDEFTVSYPNIPVYFAMKDGANFIASLIKENSTQTI